MGCLAATLLVAGTFYAYTVSAILGLMAVAPALFACVYANGSYKAAPAGANPTIRQAFEDFRSPGAVLFALLLFFQFGNEWSIAGWLPIFLIRRVGTLNSLVRQRLQLTGYSTVTYNILFSKPLCRIGCFLIGAPVCALAHVPDAGSPARIDADNRRY